MASTTNTAQGRERVTYVEEAYIVRALEEIAKETGLTPSALTRLATADYVRKMRGTDDSIVITRDKELSADRQLADRKKKPAAKAPSKAAPKAKKK